MVACGHKDAQQGNLSFKAPCIPLGKYKKTTV